MKFQQLPPRDPPDVTTSLALRELRRAVEELRRIIEAQDKRIYALENP